MHLGGKGVERIRKGAVVLQGARKAINDSRFDCKRPNKLQTRWEGILRLHSLSSMEEQMLFGEPIPWLGMSAWTHSSVTNRGHKWRNISILCKSSREPHLREDGLRSVA